MMNKACFVLIALMSPVSLFAGEKMVTETTLPPGKCDFRVDNCQTSVAEDPSYLHFKDGKTNGGSTDISPNTGNPAAYWAHFHFRDYTATKHLTVDELLAIIRGKLSNCPDVRVDYDDDTGDLTVHYQTSTCGTDCDWIVNVRNVTADDFVWKQTTDNYSPRLGQMERRKFHTTSETDAHDIETACAEICSINSWTIVQ
jgi:hypothetical protein